MKKTRQRERPAARHTVASRAATTRGRALLLNGVGLCLVGGLYVLTLAFSWSAPLVYDEAVYLQIAQKITTTGCPVDAAGRGGPFQDNPPLVMYVAALARAVGGSQLTWLRFVYVSLFALPAYIATWSLASAMFGPCGGLLALASLYTQRRFLVEASWVKLDVPLAAVTVLFALSVYRFRTVTSASARQRAGIAAALLSALACLVKHQGALVPLIGVLYLLLTRRRSIREVRPAWPELWLLAGAAAGGVVWLALNTACGGNLVNAVRANLLRTSSQTNEPWFHRPLLVYWADLATCVGPLMVGGFIASVVVWGRRLIADQRVLLLQLWVVVSFVFCSVIGLHNERYFLLAVPALALLIGSLAAPEAYETFSFLRQRPAIARGVRLATMVAVAAAAAALLPRPLAELERQRQIGPRSNAYYLALGSAVKQAIPPDERVLVSRVQTAYIAERNYFLSEYDVEAASLLDVLSNPENRITLVAMDSAQMLRDDMPAAEQQKVWDYVSRHFTTVPGASRSAAIYRRTSW